jgi:hypothetical protein
MKIIYRNSATDLKRETVQANLEASLQETSINVYHMCPKPVVLSSKTQGAKDGEDDL